MSPAGGNQGMQLNLLADDKSDIAFIAAALKDRGVKDVTEQQLWFFWERTGGDLKMAIEAIATIVAGHPYEPLRKALGR